MNKTQKAILYAFNCGYRVLKNGEVVSPKGVLRKLIKAGTTGTLYWRFNVKLDTGVFPVQVHRLAAYQIFGKRSFKKNSHVRHLDDDSLNNKLKNFALGTGSQNTMDQAPEKRQARAQHAANHLRKYQASTVALMRAKRAKGATLRVIMAEFGCAKSTASILTRNCR